ncbi:hypothetical protein LTR17_002689 [Elasticomyces elasticus]|nr:hypothetical protein LTR17_002689 [Elasticomyces elasticus]
MDEMTASSISGLREQIKANAVLLFPSLVAKYRKLDLTKPCVHIPATDAFEIVAIVGHSSNDLWQASLTYTTEHGVGRAAKSDLAKSLGEALQNLLDGTARALYEQHMKGEVFTSGNAGSDWLSYGNGNIDQGLIGDVKRSGAAAAVSELHSQRPFAPATEAFLVFITHDPDRQPLYGAGISLQQNPVGIKWMARTLDQPSVIEALRALLETTAHAILCSDGDEGNRAEWGQYGRGWIKENAVVAFPNYVGKIQALGVKQSTFLIIVTYEPRGKRYTAGLGYQTLTGFKLMAHSEEKRTVMEALGGLLHVMAEGPAKDGRARMGGVKE